MGNDCEEHIIYAYDRSYETVNDFTSTVLVYSLLVVCFPSGMFVSMIVSSLILWKNNTLYMWLE